MLQTKNQTLKKELQLEAITSLLNVRRQFYFIAYNGSRLCAVPILKLAQNLIKSTKDGYTSI